jgi:hypothetical protein
VSATKPTIVPIADVFIAQEPLTTGSPVAITATFRDIVTPPNAAEYNCIDGNRVFVVAGSSDLADNAVHAYDMVLDGATGLTKFQSAGSLDLTIPLAGTKYGEPNSCDAFDGKVYVVISKLGSEKGTVPGKMMVFDSTTLAYLEVFDTGFNPDHAAVNYQKTYIVTADEGEPPLKSPYDDSENPRGGATIVNLATKNTCVLDFNFAYTVAEYQAHFIHIQQTDASEIANDPSRDLEPEYVAFDPAQEKMAYLSVQEANMIVEIRLDEVRG